MKPQQKVAQAAALIVITLGSPAVLADDCPALAGRMPGIVRAVAVSGDHAYLGTADGLVVADVSQPQAPRLVGEVRAGGGWPFSVAVSGPYAYVASSGDLSVVDVSIPSAPVLVARLNLAWYVSSVAVSGNHAFVTGGGEWPSDGDLFVIDVTVPWAPVVVGSARLPVPGSSVTVSGTHAYVADWDAGLRVIDVSVPSAPVEVGFVDIPGDAVDVAVSGSNAYVAWSDAHFNMGGLQVIDISIPSAPLEIGYVSMAGSPTGVEVSGRHAYVANSDTGLRVIDVSIPSAPVEVGFVDTLESAYGLAVSGNYAYVATSRRSGSPSTQGLSVVDVATPSAPVEVGFAAALGEAYDVAVSGHHAYIAAEYAPVKVVDISVLAAPVEVAQFDTPDSPTEVAVADGFAYVADDRSGLRVIDVSTPSAPVEVGFVDTPDRAWSVAVEGHYAYVVWGVSYPSEGGLLVINVSTPSAPIEVGSVGGLGDARDVTVSDGYAYVVWGAWYPDAGGLRVVDVSNPSAPIEVGSIDMPVRAWGVAVEGNHAYVAAEDTGLRVIDVSIPSSPVEVGSLSPAGSASSIAVSGPYAYLGGWAGEASGGYLRVIDVSIPSAPVEVGVTGTLESVNDVSVSGRHVFLAAGSAGLYVYNDCGQFADAHVSFIPAAAYAAGAEGAFFQTDVEINNRGAREAEAYFEWLPRGEDNSAPQRSTTFGLGPGKSLRLENVLTTLFELGPDSLGAVKIVASTESVIGMSRTYNTPAGGATGTFGQGLPAIRATEMIAGTEPQRIIFLSEGTDFRANVGCVNGTSEPVRINIWVFDDEGSLLRTRTMDLAPWSNHQINRVFGGLLPVNGYVDVGAGSNDAVYYCYGSLLDNRTSDPTTILPQVPLAGTSYIPAAALSVGLEGSFFETDIDLNNAGRRDVTYDLLWLPRGADNSDPIHSRTFSLAPGSGVRYANVLNEVFGLEPDQVGALAIEASGTELLAMSRTYNLPPVITAGTFGQGLPAVRETVMIGSGERQRIIFMNENAGLRSNVGCQNGSLRTVRVLIELFSAEGESLEIKTMDLQPLSNNQITRVFRDYSPISAGYVDVWTNAAGASIYCYGSVLDNLTSDPTTVLPQ